MKYYFLLHNDHILLAKNGDKYSLPVDPIDIETNFHFPLGFWQGHEIYCAAIEPIHSHPHFALLNLREAYYHLSQDHFKLASRARQIIDWQRDHRFCGRCGHLTEFHDQNRAKICPACQLISYPRISPCMMAAVINHDKILLARSPHFPPGRYSVLAGFIEPGETVEECVHREVYEEVGVAVKHIRYVKSQPWPFPNSLMLGFFADYDGGDIKIDGIEIEDARWVRRDELSHMQLPPPISLAYELIARFQKNEL